MAYLSFFFAYRLNRVASDFVRADVGKHVELSQSPLRGVKGRVADHSVPHVRVNGPQMHCGDVNTRVFYFHTEAFGEPSESGFGRTVGGESRGRCYRGEGRGV